MDLWWDRAERLRWELEQLKSAGLRFDDPENLEKPGPIVVRVYKEIDGDEHPLDVVFPDLYPYFRLEVLAPTLSLEHHQNPFSKNLCLIGRASEEWYLSDSAAAFVVDLVPSTIELGRLQDATAAKGREWEQAEPVSDYYPYEDEAIILIDSSWVLPRGFTCGRIRVGFERTFDDPIRGVVLSVKDADGQIILTAPDHLKQLFAHTMEGHITKLDEPLFVSDPTRFERIVRTPATPPLWQGPSKIQRSLLAVVFPEEASWRGEGQGWLFVAGVRSRRDKRSQRHYFCRAGRAGSEDLRQRVPELAPTRDKTVAVFGLGCIGAPSALEFARSGLKELRLLDKDFVDPGTICRWPFGFPAAGRSKSRFLAQFIRENFPLTAVRQHHHRLGGPEDSPIIDKMIDGTALIYDAVNELGVSHFLADAARHHGLPYIGVFGTQGGWGGTVVRLRADGSTGCWFCFRRAEMEGKVPHAPADESKPIQPIGCADPTFIGAGFDLAAIALTGVRLALSTLLEGSKGYPATDWDVAVIQHRTDEGAMVPQIQTVKLTPYSDCRACAGGLSASGSL